MLFRNFCFEEEKKKNTIALFIFILCMTPPIYGFKQEINLTHQKTPRNFGISNFYMNFIKFAISKVIGFYMRQNAIHSSIHASYINFFFIVVQFSHA